MLQIQTKILIKDNSGLLQGKIINSGRAIKRNATVGNSIKIAVTRAKSKAGLGKNIKTSSRVQTSSKGQLQDLLIIQTKKIILRNDGSTVKFDSNSGVCISFRSAHKKLLQFGFKRINTSVPFELKKHSHWQTFKGSYNLIKLAKNLL
jgi:ribosomal protein L14